MVPSHPKHESLDFSIYVKSGASASQELLEQNDALLRDIFEICSQYGDVPIILAGDFQTAPLNYESISNAIHMCGWQDPLLQVDNEGLSFRPLTPIDGIILNRVAFAALRHIHVLETLNQQHRPISASFHWPSIFLEGDVHVKTAPRDVSAVPVPNSEQYKDFEHGASSLWERKFPPPFEAAHCPAREWSIVNGLCLETLVNTGARWGFGPRTRGHSPKFARKKICLGQTPPGAATAKKASIFYNTMGRLQELFVRAQRMCKSHQDFLIFRTTARRCRNGLLAAVDLVL